MGIEFQCRFDPPASGRAIEHVLNRIATLQGLISLGDINATSKLHLRFADIPARRTWSEDMSIELNPEGCYVVFHNGGLRKCQAIVAEIQSLLRQEGLRCELEEL